MDRLTWEEAAGPLLTLIVTLKYHLAEAFKSLCSEIVTPQKNPRTTKPTMNN